jgi:hypothetical protein
MERLIKHGFVVAGYWFLQNNSIYYNLNSCQKAKEVLYAFTYQGKVKYIGKTDQEIEKRMNGYRNPNRSQSTNMRVHNNIRKILEVGERIDILIFVDINPKRHGDYNINLAAGLEGGYIFDIQPEWNNVGKYKYVKISKDKYSKPILQYKNTTLPSANTTSFYIILRDTYHNRGFFNVPTRYSGCFGANEEEIEISLENKSSQIIVGKIDRKDNRTGTPRIKGSTQLRDWIQENFKLQEVMKVEVLTPTSIRLYK